MVLDNVRALVQAAESEPNAHLPEKYRSLCKRFGSLVRNSGLASAVAFLRAGGEPHHEALLTHLRTELNATAPFPSGTVGGSGSEFHDFIVDASLSDYMIATREVLRLLYWHRRIVETLVEDEEEA